MSAAANLQHRRESGTAVADMREALVCLAPSREKAGAEIRLYRVIAYTAIYYADDELLVSQHAHGIPAAHAPVLHLRRTVDGDMVPNYLASFVGVWADARPLD